MIVRYTALALGELLAFAALPAAAMPIPGANLDGAGRPSAVQSIQYYG